MQAGFAKVMTMGATATSYLVSTTTTPSCTSASLKNFKNVNVSGTDRPMSDLDLMFLKKAAVISKHITKHFQCLVALKLPDMTIVSLSLVPTARCLAFVIEINVSARSTNAPLRPKVKASTSDTVASSWLTKRQRVISRRGELSSSATTMIQAFR